MPDVVCDTDGSPVDPATAKGDHRRALDRPARRGAIPPAQPQARRRPAGDADTGDQGGEGPAPSPPGTRAVRRAWRRRTRRPFPPRILGGDPGPGQAHLGSRRSVTTHPAEAAGATGGPGTALPAVSLCPGPAGTRGTRASAAGPAGTRSALDAWGAGPYQRPAADPLDKPAPIGNQLREPTRHGGPAHAADNHAIKEYPLARAAESAPAMKTNVRSQ